MPLPSFLQRQAPTVRKKVAASAPAGDSVAVEAARTRARRRLIGAVVLLAIGIIGFPLVFETKPRPIPLDIRIDAPSSASQPAPTVAASVPAPAPEAVVKTQKVTAAPTAVASAPDIIIESAADAGRDVTPPAPQAKVTKPAPAALPPPQPALQREPDIAKPAAPPPTPTHTAKADDGARARALLNGAALPAAPAAASGERFVVQVGAYSDASSLHAARRRVEKLGLTSYTQVVETPDGKRTRVRVGPFATHVEAERAGAKLKSAGLPVAILTL